MLDKHTISCLSLRSVKGFTMTYLNETKKKTYKMKKRTRTFLEKITTIHGTNHLHLRSGKTRIMWWLSMVLTFALTVAFIEIIQQKLRNDQIYTKVDSTCQVNQVPFPAVSICNMNMVSTKETANIARLLKQHNRTEKEIDKFFEDLPKLKHSMTPRADKATEIMDILRSYSYSMDTIMEEVYQRCESLLLYCEFNRRRKNCIDVFNLIKTVEGHCCAFNYAALNDVSEVSLLPHDDTLEYYDGDEESDHVSGTIIATSESGRSSGLTVVFNVEPKDYPPWTRAYNYAATVLISDPNDFPETSARDTFVIAGTAVDIKVEPRVYQSESDVRRVSPEHRACWFHDEVNLEHTDRYSYETCATECTMASFIKSCGCTPYKYPRDESRRFCELADLPCMYNLTVYGKSVACDPPCYVECRDKGYLIRKNTLPFFESDYPSDVTKDQEISELAAIKVYFSKSTCSCYKLTLLMDVNYFIANYGGILGLSFGASLLTVAELIYLIVSYLYEKIFKNISKCRRRR